MEDEKKMQEPEEKEISKAFGNEQPKAEKKEEPAQADPKAKVNDPEQEGAVSAGDDKKQKTYTQEEVDAITAKMRKKYQGKGAPTQEAEPVAEADPKENTSDDEESQELPVNDLATGISMDKYVQAELKGTMAMADVDPKKLGRAVRLIDPATVIENGIFSEEKAQHEIEMLLQEWPELKRAEQGTENNSFSFGAPLQDENSENNTATKVSHIFGNK